MKYIFCLGFLFLEFFSNAQFDSSLVLMNSGNYKSAIKLLKGSKPENIQQKNKKNTLLGNAYLALNFNKKALRYYSKIKPGNDSDIINQLTLKTNVYIKLNQYNKTIKHLDKIITIQPNNSQAYTIKGVVYCNLGYFKNAIYSFKEAIKIDSLSAIAYLNLGYAIYFNQDIEQAHSRDIELAIYNFSKATELNPLFINAYLNRGQAYIYLEKYEKALADFDYIIDLQPTFFAPWYNKGIIYYKTNEFQNAKNCFLKAFELNPEFLYAKLMYTVADARLGNFYQSVETLKDLKKTKNQLGIVSYNLALVYALNNETEWCLNELKTAYRDGFFNVKENRIMFKNQTEFKSVRTNIEFNKIAKKISKKY